jgi:hypothetical protein
MSNSSQGINRERGEEQPGDKERAQKVHKTEAGTSVSQEETRRSDHQNSPRKDGRSS